MNPFHRHTLTWIVLVILSLVNFAARSQEAQTLAQALIPALAGMKAISLAWQFMELRQAHWLWTAVLGSMVLVILGLIYLLGR